MEGYFSLIYLTILQFADYNRTKLIGIVTGEYGMATVAETRKIVQENYAQLWQLYAHDINEAFYPFVLAQIRRALKQGRPLHTALEIGCGAGGLAFRVSQLIPEVLGVDSTDEMVKKTQELAKLSPSKMTATKGDFNINLGLPAGSDQKFDFVYSVYTLAYADSLEEVLRQIDSHLSANGMVVLVEVAGPAMSESFINWLEIPQKWRASRPKPTTLAGKLWRIIREMTMLQPWIYYPLSVMSILISLVWFPISSLLMNGEVNFKGIMKGIRSTWVFGTDAWSNLEKVRHHMPYPEFFAIVKQVWPTAKTYKISADECVIIYKR